MFQIGEFSRLAHVSSRLLRHYDDIGLLKPARVDRSSGYRYYSAAQFAALNRILVLRDLGFSLEQIDSMLKQSLSTERLRGMLASRRAEVERELELQAGRLRRLERRIADVEAGEDGLADVVVRAVPTCHLLSARPGLHSLDAGRAFVAALLDEVPERLGGARRGRLIVIQHAPTFEPDALDLEVGFVLEAGPVNALEVRVAGKTLGLRQLPGLAVAATCVRVGPPEEVHSRCRQLAACIEAEGLRLDGPNRELFLRPPAPNQQPVIEMQFPVRAQAEQPS